MPLAANETRIQAFFRLAALDDSALALLLGSLLPRGTQLRGGIDRTEWDFGKCPVNIVRVTGGCGDLQWPLGWALWDHKSGNSNAADRIRLRDFCLQGLGSQRIGWVVGDREFVGQSGFANLTEKKGNFLMRVPQSHFLTDSRQQAGGGSAGAAPWPKPHLVGLPGRWGLGAGLCHGPGGRGVPVFGWYGPGAIDGATLPQAVDH